MKASVRSAINRENASHSTGPVTEAGKARSSANSWKHGLTAQKLLHSEEELPDYLEFAREYMLDLRPVGVVEINLAQQIADSNWRLNRIAAIENNLLQSEMENHVPDSEPDTLAAAAISQARAWQSMANSFDKFSRYEGRLSRYMFKLTAELRTVQAARHARDSRENALRALHAVPPAVTKAAAQSAQAPEKEGFISSSALFGQAVADYLATQSPETPAPPPPAVPHPAAQPASAV